MNKKFINLLLASVLAVSSAQVFTSCKDNEADLQANVQYQYESLEKRVAANEDLLNKLPEQLQDLKDALEGKIDGLENTLQGQIDSYKQELKNAIDNAKNGLQSQINTLSTQTGNNAAEIDSLKNKIAELDSLLDAINGNFNALQGQLATVEGSLGSLSGDFNTFKDEYAQQIEVLIKELAAQDVDLSELREAINQNIQDIINLRTALDVVNQRLDAIEKTLEILPKLDERVGTLEEQLSKQAEKITLLEGEIGSTKSDLEALKNIVEPYMKDTDIRLEAIEEWIANWQSIITGLQEDVTSLKTYATVNDANIAAINATIEDLMDADASNASVITGLQMQISDMLARMDEFATLTELGEVSSYLQKQAKNYYSQSIAYTNLMIEQVLAQFASQIDDVKSDVSAIYGKIGHVEEFQNALKDRVDALESGLINVNTSIDGINGSISGILGDINDIQDNLEFITDQITGINGDIISNYNELKEAIDALDTKVSDIENGLGQLNGRIEEVAGRLSGIVIQGTYNNAIGSLRLPIGIQSNLLLAYLGEVANAGGTVEFPLVEETAGTYNGDISNSLTMAEASVLGVGTGKVPVVTYSGYYMNTTESNPNAGYLGTVYATINPSKVDLSDKTFNLVNSRGEKIVNPLEFVPSNKELDFGYSRSAENGFYEAAATVDINESAFKSIRFIFDENLKSTVKDILKEPRASVNRNTVTQLAKAVINQFNGFLPAIGIEATWNDSQLGEMGVTSNYAIATAVVKPLSFKFFQGQSVRNIPNLPTLSQLQDKFNTIYDEVKGDLTIDLTDETVSFDLGGGVHGKLDVDIVLPSLSNPTVYVIVDVDGKTGIGFGTVDLSGYESALQDVVNAINKAFADYDASVDTSNADLQAAFDDVANQVNALVQSIEVKVNTTIQDVSATLQNKVNGLFESQKASQIEKLLDRIDAVINRLNRILDDPNHYLQPALFYNTDSEFAEVSRNKYVPTQLTLVGNANAITLVPTTYTYETVAPVFKKYVAVTKVWRNDDAAQNNIDHVALEANNNTNFNTYMNQVVDGSCRRIALKLQKGYTYEVFYQALDFNGYVSGGKYYISVK